jgi:hypothetical protein
MERGADSWRVIFDPLSIPLHQALFVRDTAGLEIESKAEVPPRLRGDLPDCRDYLSSDLRVGAGLRWISWWHELVHSVAARQQISLSANSGPLPQQLPFGMSGILPPMYLDGELDESSMVALDRIFELASQWSATLRTNVGASRPPTLVSSDMHNRFSSIASETATQLGVSTGAMKAAILTLAVSGKWSRRPIAGVLLCSESVLEDDGQFAGLLADTFISGLNPQVVEALLERPAERSAARSVLDSPLLIARVGEMTLRLEGVYVRQGGFELELSRNGDLTGIPPRPYSKIEGLPSDPEGSLNHFDGLELEVRFTSELLDEKKSVSTQSSTFVNRFWRPGRSPDTLWLWVRVESPLGQVMMSNRGIVTVTATWPESQIYRCSVEFEMRS